MIALLALAALCVLAYLPILAFPFIADDYHQIRLARSFAAQGWGPLWGSGAFNHRLPYVFLSYGLDRVFGFTPLPFYVASIVLHILCTWAVFGLGIWHMVGWRISFLAAAFFAVHEGHQEAVMWVAASMELFVFLFGTLTAIAWIHWLQSRRVLAYVAALLCFLATLYSKESGVVFAGLLLLPLYEHRRRWLEWLPFAGLAVWQVVSMMASRESGNWRFNDGSFSWSAPWLLTFANSYGRLLFIWGVLALIALVFWRTWKRPLVLHALLWCAIGLLPYCFLTYMSRVPSRHTYIASAGLALLVGYALNELRQRHRPAVMATICSVIVLVNVGTLWGRKRSQFLERARPTEVLKQAWREASGPVTVRCFPYPEVVATNVAEEYGGSLVMAESAGVQDCFAVEYRDSSGALKVLR